MLLNRILSQQIDSLFYTLELEGSIEAPRDMARKEALKLQLAKAIEDVANASDIQDASKYLRIEAHFKIMVDKLLDVLNKKQPVPKSQLPPVDVQAQQDFEARIKILAEQLNKFKKDLLQSESLPMTIDALKDEHNKLLGIFKVRKLQLSAHTGSLRTKALEQPKQIHQQISNDLEEAVGDIILLQYEAELYPNLLSRLKAWAHKLNAPKAEKYFDEMSKAMIVLNEIETMQHWLSISGAHEVNDINEAMLRKIANTSREQIPTTEEVIDELQATFGIESMLAAILYMAGKEQQIEGPVNKMNRSQRMPVHVVHALFVAHISDAEMKFKIAAQQKLFLEAIQWRTLVLKDDFMQTAAELLHAGDLPEDVQTKIMDSIDTDANLHSSDPTRVREAHRSLYEIEKIAKRKQEMKQENVRVDISLKEYDIVAAASRRQIPAESFILSKELHKLEQALCDTPLAPKRQMPPLDDSSESADSDDATARPHKPFKHPRR